jgi:hypothetical protein
MIACGMGMFILKYHVVAEEEKLQKLYAQILRDRREIHLLQADWAVLTDPNHLRRLVQEQTKLKTLNAAQIISKEETKATAGKNGKR